MRVVQPDDAREGVAPDWGGGGIAGVYVSSLPPCDQVTGTVLGPQLLLPASMAKCSDLTTLSSVYGATQDPATKLCPIIDSGIQTLTVCGKSQLQAASAITSRNIHLPVSGQFTRCGMSLVTPTSTDLNTLISQVQQSACTNAVNAGVPNTSGWQWAAGATGCGSNDAILNPSSTTSDSVNASYYGVTPQSQDKALSITSLTYQFVLPRPNLFLDLTASFNYHVANALVYMTVIAGDRTSSILVAGDPGVKSPGLDQKGSTGSTGWHAGLLSGNVSSGTITFTVIPTTWISSSAPLTSSKFELCNLGLRATTYVRARWPFATPVPTGPGPTASNSIKLQTDPDTSGNVVRLMDEIPAAHAVCRNRKAWNSTTSTFVSLGSECAEIWLGVDTPKDDTNSDATNHSPLNGESSGLADLRNATGTSILTFANTQYDPKRGVQTPGCPFGDPSLLCTALDAGQALLRLPALKANGRIFSTLPIPDDALRGSGGTVAPVVGMVPPSAMATGYSRCTVAGANCGFYPAPAGALGYTLLPAAGAFFEPENHAQMNSFSGTVSTGTLSVAQGSGGNILTIIVRPLAGAVVTISANLNCMTINGNSVCAP